MKCLFATDLHGSIDRYEKLFKQLLVERPGVVFLGGDLLDGLLQAFAAASPRIKDFLGDYLVPRFLEVKKQMGADWPRVLLILGNDDGRFIESAILDAAVQGCWTYAHDRRIALSDNLFAFGYSFIPPSPFMLKDWERYDVSRFVDPGCVSPEEGRLSVPVEERVRRYSTIAEDLDNLAGTCSVERSIFLFHAPPYQTAHDRAVLDGQMVDHAPVDVHVGSIAIQRFITDRQPMLTLHGHVHESTRITGQWHTQIGKTHLFGGAHDGPELALIRFDTQDLQSAERLLL